MDKETADRNIKMFMQRMDDEEKRKEEALRASFQTDQKSWEALKDVLGYEEPA